MKSNIYSLFLIFVCFQPGFSQTINNNLNLLGNNKIINCGTANPDYIWLSDFESAVEVHKKNKSLNKQASVNYTIPVIVHIIHSGGAIGGVNSDNISQAQVLDQISILNADFAGTGLNVGNVPATFSASVSNCEITFCLAQKDTFQNSLAEIGIRRVLATSIAGVTNVPVGGFTQTFVDNTIKPATIWNPKKYCNIWVLKLSSLAGFGTFPAASGLSGVGSVGTVTNDGVVVNYTNFGSIGTATLGGLGNKGRTLVHELGHWLGVLHLNGAMPCGNDYCNDTPIEQTPNFNCPSSPVITCTNGPNGDMYMNFMEYTSDVCKYMFTPDQKSRMHTAITNGTYRQPLLASANNLCGTPNALNENTDKNNFVNVFPNPVREQLNIKFNLKMNESANVKIQNLLGEQVAEFYYDNIQNEIKTEDLSFCESGVYLIIVNTSSNTKVMRVVIQK